jgi:hypothetical protein
MTYEVRGTKAASRMHVQQKKVVFQQPDSDDDEGDQDSSATGNVARAHAQPPAPKQRRRRSKHRKPSLALRRKAPTLNINAAATKDVLNDEDLTEEQWTDAALDELFESALSAPGSSSPENANEDSFFTATSSSPP